MTTARDGRRGFTLLELQVATILAILAILATSRMYQAHVSQLQWIEDRAGCEGAVLDQLEEKPGVILMRTRPIGRGRRSRLDVRDVSIDGAQRITARVVTILAE